MTYPFTVRQANVLRAVAAARGGLRISACRATMPGLATLGLVKHVRVYPRRVSVMVWQLTPAGRRALAEIGSDEP